MLCEQSYYIICLFERNSSGIPLWENSLSENSLRENSLSERKILDKTFMKLLTNENFCV